MIEKLNKELIILNKFEMSAFDVGKIKIASIIKFALRYIVDIGLNGKKNFYNYWVESDRSEELLLKLDNEEFESYLSFCVSKLSMYFSAIKKNFDKKWNDPISKLLSITSINGFIIAYYRFIDLYGIKNHEFFCQQFKNLKTDFSKEKFPYTSSRYKQFSEEIFQDVLLVRLDEKNKIYDGK